MTICFPNATIDEIKALIQPSIDWLDQQASPERGGSRFGELDAYDFLGLDTFFPVGKVPTDAEGIRLCGLRRDELKKAIELLNTGVDSQDQGGGNDGGGSEGEDCAELIDALNKIAIALNIEDLLDLKFNFYSNQIVNETSTRINARINEAEDLIIETDIENSNNIAGLIAALGLAIANLSAKIDGLKLDVNLGDILAAIGGVRILIEGQNVKLDRIEECACDPESEIDFDLQDIIDGVSNQVKINTDESLLNLLNNIQTYIEQRISQLQSNLINAINNPQYLQNLLSQIQEILTAVAITQEIVSLINNLSSQVDNRFSETSETLSNITNTLNTIDARTFITQGSVNDINSDVDQIEILLNQIGGDSEDPTDLTEIQNSLTLINNKIDSLDPPELSGSLAAIGCDDINTYVYSGKGFLGLSNQLVSLSSQINKLHEDICDEETYTIEIPEIDCEDPEVVNQRVIEGSFEQVVTQGILTIGSLVTDTKREVCLIENEPNCFLLKPTEDFEEFTLERQLIIHWRTDDNEPLRSASKWDSVIYNPIDNLDWCQHLDQLRWEKGNIAGRYFYRKGKQRRLAGYFSTEEEANRVLNYMSTLSKEEFRGSIRTTKGGLQNIDPELRIIRPYKAVIVDIVNGKEQVTKCLAPPRGGC